MKPANMKRLHVTQLGCQTDNLSHEITQAQWRPSIQHLLIIWLLAVNTAVMYGNHFYCHARKHLFCIIPADWHHAYIRWQPPIITLQLCEMPNLVLNLPTADTLWFVHTMCLCRDCDGQLSTLCSCTCFICSLALRILCKNIQHYHTLYLFSFFQWKHNGSGF